MIEMTGAEILQQIIDESDRQGVREFVAEHNAVPSAERGTMCMWTPCTYILFGQQGETHEQYHQRKGKF